MIFGEHQNQVQLEAFSVPGLVLLTLSPRIRFKTLAKRLVLSLYWFLPQQQTSTIRQQKIASFYPKYNAMSEELTPKLLKANDR